MPFSAGQIVTAQQLNRLQPVSYQAIASTDRTGTVTNQDVLGASITLTTETNSAVYVATGTFDFDVVSGQTLAVTASWSGGLAVDGTVQTARALVNSDGTGTQRFEASKEWRGTLATAGSHTLKLVTTHSGADSVDCVTRSIHSVITVVIYEIV